MDDSPPPAADETMDSAPVPCGPELFLMPDEVVGKIAGFSGLEGVVKIGKVCSRFHNLLHEQPPSINHQAIYIHERRNLITTKYGTNDEKPWMRTVYENIDGGCAVWNSKPGKPPIQFPKEDYKEMFSNDLEKNWRLQKKTLDILIIYADEDTVKRVASIMETVDHPLEIEHMTISTRNIKDVMSVLQNICPNTLQSVWFEIYKSQPPLSDDQIKQLASLEHWKTIKAIQIDARFENPLCMIANFLHVQGLHIHVGDLRIDHLVALKEMILRPDFKVLDLGYTSIQSREEFNAMMGSNGLEMEDPYNTKSKKTDWYFAAPHGNDVLCVELYQDRVTLKIIKPDEIPAEAIVKPMFQFPHN